MADNPFLAPSINPFLAPSVGANPFLRDEQPLEPDRGFLGSLVHETGRDITGFAKTLVAPWGSLAEMVGLSAPVTWDDLTTRDLTGWAMTSSMFVGGVASAGIKSVLAGQGLRALGRGATSTAARSEVARFSASLGFVKNALITGGAEAGAGAFFGSLKPLDADESRLESVLGNAALFGGFGGAFSMAGSAVKATVGQRLALIKGTHRTQLLAEAAQRETSRQFLQEFAGVRLRAPETGSLLEVKRLADGTVQAITKNGDSATTSVFPTFGEAIASAFESGHTERLGAARTKLSLTDVSRLDEGVLRQVQAADNDIIAALGDLEFGGYKAARDLIQKHRESDLLLDWLGIEAVTERMTLHGAVALDPRTKQQMLALLPKNDARRIGPLGDADFLREAMKAGVVDVANIADATQARTFLRELAANEYIPDANLVIAARSTYDATFLSGLVSSRTLAKIHPELQPFVDLSLSAAETQRIGQTAAESWIEGLLNKIPRIHAEAGVRIIDESLDPVNAPALELKRISAEANPFVPEGATKILITPSAKKPGQRQISFFNDAGQPLGDIVRRSQKEILELAGDLGFEAPKVSIQAAREAALAAARKTGQQEVISFVEETIKKLNYYRLRAVAAGRLGSAQAVSAGRNEALLAGTKVVDETGTPRRVFHGTFNAFDDFDFERADQGALYGPGAYFTESAEIADGYARAKLPARERVQANIKRLEQEQADTLRNIERARSGEWAKSEAPDVTVKGLEVELKSIEADLSAARADLSSHEAGPNIRPARLALRNPFDIDASFTSEAATSLVARFIKDTGVVGNAIFSPGPITGHDIYTRLTNLLGAGDAAAKARVNQWLKTQGFDGITHIGGGRTGNAAHRVWIVFGREQVASAFDSSNGTVAAPEVVAAARQIIKQVVDAPDVADGLAAEQAALQALEAAGPEVAAVGRELLEDAGRAGYFPIVNVGGYHLSVNGERFGGMHKTFNDALKAASEIEGTAFISPAMTADTSTVRAVSGREFGKLVKAVEQAEGLEVTAAEAAEMLKAGGTIPSGGGRKFSGHLQQRRLGIRDFAEDPFTSLRFYASNMERTLAYDTFERQAEALISNIPTAKRGVREWAEREADLLLGRPTTTERQFQSIVEGLGLAQAVGPRALKSFSSAIRHFQSFMKLGGVWSGVINATQFATATVAKLGTKYSAIGLEAILLPAKRREALALLREGGIDLGLHSFGSDGSMRALDSVSGELKAVAARLKIGEGKASAAAAARALENMYMFSFSGAERMNRLGTFYGAFRKAHDDLKMTREASLGWAHDMVLKTQFDYSPANTPQLLAGPVGSVLGQFKSFFVYEIEMIAQMTPKERLKLMVTFQALGGMSSLLAMPGADLIDSASRFMFDKKMSEALKIAGGDEDADALTKFTAFGLPGLRNLDFSRSIGPGGIADLTRGWLGPTASDIGAYASFMGGVVSDQAKHGEVRPETWNAFLQKALPSQIRRIHLGLDIIDSGEVRNPYTQKLIYQPEQRLKVGVLQAIGTPTTRLTQERMMDEVVQRQVDSYRAARASYRQQIALAFIEGRNTEAQAAIERARASGIVFKPRDLRTAVRDFSSDARARREERTPIALRDDLLDFYSQEGE